ncbi:hypothetical protein EVAR_48548_1 [Eumeta japonica]|uniref:Uncharacterized protein n=1 Tax=Eumeta variegata TaxID=151549 RepID=A0A4C1YAU7_EUMVA|nr:hypothetical protein EVAR_48548_1 [Eumeta japonica]
MRTSHISVLSGNNTCHPPDAFSGFGIHTNDFLMNVNRMPKTGQSVTARRRAGGTKTSAGARAPAQVRSTKSCLIYIDCYAPPPLSLQR